MGDINDAEFNSMFLAGLNFFGIICLYFGEFVFAEYGDDVKDAV